MLSTRSEVPGVPDHELPKAKYQGLGGFPGPSFLAQQVLRITAPHAYPKIQRKLERTWTLPSVTTLQSENVPWLNFNGLVVGRNSDFRTETLTDEQLEDIGGAEYRALRLLSWLAPTVSMGTFPVPSSLVVVIWRADVAFYSTSSSASW